MLYILLYILIVFPLALRHDVIARKLGNKFSRAFFSNHENETYWTVVDQVKKKRTYIKAILILLISVITYLSYMLLGHTQFSLDSDVVLDFWFGLVIFLIVYFLLEIFNHYKTPSEHNELADYHKIQRILENLSITAGINPPQLILYAGNMPKVFLHLEAVGAPQLYVSTSFLQHFSTSEAEAYIAHEIGHYLSNEVTTKRSIEWMILTFKAIGLVFFLLLLASVHPGLPFVWLTVYVYLVIRTFFLKYESLNSNNNAGLIYLVMNPVHLLVVLISGIIHYTMNYGEAVYADLKAIELTRYPQALYSALSKVLVLITDGTYKKFTYYSPFLLRDTTEEDQAFKEQFIKDRLTLIKSFDQTVTDSYSSIKLLTCSVCDHLLTEIDVLGPYDINRKAWACSSCGHLWFDKGSLYALSSIETKDYFEKYLDSTKSKSHKQPPYPCPRCQVALFEIRDSSIPKNIRIYPCHSCHGNLVSAVDFMTYTQYRLSLSQKNITHN